MGIIQAVITVSALGGRENRPSCHFVWVALALIVVSCGGGESAFRVDSIEPATGKIAQNEPIVIGFSAEIAPDAFLTSLVTLHDSKGRPIPYSPQISGRSLLLRPRSKLSWPLNAEMELVIQKGWALSLESVDGRTFDTEYRTRLTVEARYRDYGDPFELVEVIHPRSGRLGPGTALVLNFSLPVDPTSVAKAFRIKDHQGGEGWAKVECQDDGRKILVYPHAVGGGLNPQQHYELIVDKTALRSLTGRSLDRLQELISFWSSPVTAQQEGVVEFEFKLENSSGENKSRWARPISSPFRTVRLNREYTDFSREKERHLSAQPFSRLPSRLQVLLAGKFLGDEPGLITGLSWFATELPTFDLIFPRIILEIGYAAQRVGQPGLSTFFDDNFAEVDASTMGSARLRTVPFGSEEGEWMPSFAHAKINSDGRGQGWISLRFDRPFYYGGASRDLILDIDNLGGCFPLDPSGLLPDDFEGLFWAGGRPATSGQFSSLSASSGMLEGIADKTVFATKIEIERYEEFVTLWVPVPAERPSFFQLPSSGSLDTDGVSGVDFEFEFQGKRSDGKLTPWGQLGTLAGCRTIRAKLKFLPLAGRYANRPPEVRRLRVRYKDTSRP
ncbi:MAG: Ig-like domain-containing protein [Planctomycetota bacterium]